MANNYDFLKAFIVSKVYDNVNQEITGEGLQEAILALVDQLGKFLQNGGVATVSGEPQVGDVPVIFLADQPGTYTHYGNITVATGEVALLVYDNGEWQKVSLHMLSSADGAVKERNIESGAVTESKIADDAVTENKVKDGNITEEKVADDAITTNKIKDGNVTENKIADDAVKTAKIADDAVVTSKIKDKAVTTDKIADGAIGTEQLKDGKVTLADNLASWAARSQMEVIDEWSTRCRTTGGDLSIDTSKGAYILRLITRSSFKASLLSASGANLLNPEVTVGGAYVFMVPVMKRGDYGTADEANGIVFVDKDGNNLHPTVRFSETYPASAADGEAVTPYQFAGHSEYFYPSAKIGYFIVSDLGVSAANACARIAWSTGYQTYEAYRAPSSINLSNVIAAIAASHSGNSDRMLAVGGVSDEVLFGSSAAAWTRRVSVITPTWADTDNGDGTYTHTATIPDTNGAMKAGGLAEDYAGVAVLAVEGTTVSYTDSNATSNVKVKYELATEATGTVSQTNAYQPDDFGIEYLTDAVGEFVIRTSYYQGMPDTVASLISLAHQNEANTAAIDVDNMGDAHCKSIDMDELPKVCGYQLIVIASGAPSTAPDFIGQVYIDTANGKVYVATGVSASTDYKILN